MCYYSSEGSDFSLDREPGLWECNGFECFEFYMAWKRIIFSRDRSTKPIGTAGGTDVPHAIKRVQVSRPVMVLSSQQTHQLCRSLRVFWNNHHYAALFGMQNHHGAAFLTTGAMTMCMDQEDCSMSLAPS